MGKNKDALLLNCVYRGARTGQQAIDDLMPRVHDRAFASDLETQRSQYCEIGREAASRMADLGETPVPVGELKRLGMKIGVAMNTMANDDTSYLAQLMIKGSNMGVINLTKAMNRAAGVSGQAMELAGKLVTAQQNNIERLKTYLR